jgi:hypothetical protein
MAQNLRDQGGLAEIARMLEVRFALARSSRPASSRTHAQSSRSRRSY